MRIVLLTRCGVAWIAVATLWAPACGGRPRAHPQLPVPAPAAADEDTGIASWYGHPYHGRRAASGEIYDMEQMTAAHRTLPFGTRVRVHHLATGRRVDVRINDRGPFVAERIIDLSRAAARALGMMGAGLARVRLEVLESSSSPADGSFAVQVGAFRDRANAERLQEEMERRYGAARITAFQADAVFWRVLVGRLESLDAARALARKIRAEEREKAGEAFAVRVDEVVP